MVHWHLDVIVAYGFTRKGPLRTGVFVKLYISVPFKFPAARVHI